MKKKTVVISLLALSIVVSCNKMADLVKIRLDLPYSQSVSLPQALIYDTSVTHYFPTSGVSYSSPNLPVSTGQSNILSSHNSAANKISSFSLTQLVLVDSPSTAHFDFLDTVRMYICKTANDSTLIAYKYGVTTGLDSLVLDQVANSNLLPYFILDTFYFRFSGHFKSLPPNSLQKMTIHSIMHLEADPLN